MPRPLSVAARGGDGRGATFDSAVGGLDSRVGGALGVFPVDPHAPAPHASYYSEFRTRGRGGRPGEALCGC